MAICVGVCPPGQQTPFITFELEDDGTWRLKPPYPPNRAQYVPQGTGTWKKEFLTGYCIIQDAAGKPCFELHGFERTSGDAVVFENGQRPAGASSVVPWKRVAKPFSGKLGIWSGMVAKIGGGAGIGAEMTWGTVTSVDNGKSWFDFNLLSGRVELGVGIGGGASIAVFTGVHNPNTLHNTSQSGSDYALSVGGRWGTVAKSLGLAGKNLKTAEQIAKFVIEHGDQLNALAKGMVQELTLDWEEPNLLVVDTPLGAGAELGVYWWWGTLTIGDQGYGPRLR